MVRSGKRLQYELEIMQILTGALVISTTATFYLKSTLECFLTILLSPIGNHQGSNHLEVNRTGDSAGLRESHVHDVIITKEASVTR
jgi:hypothetical protein